MLVCLNMADNPSPPDYELADRMALTEPSQVKAISHPLRTTILGLFHERAATVTELAIAVERPKSTVAHHVKVLTEAGLVQVVRTRRVRAIEERLYGRTARMFYVGVERSREGNDLPLDFNDFEVAAQESDEAYRDGKLWVSFGTPASRRRRRRSSGSGWRSWWRSSSGSRARARPCMDSRSVSIPPTIRPSQPAPPRTRLSSAASRPTRRPSPGRGSCG